ncbi:MAG: cytidine deaminase [Lachnospiraceae bacterium]|nr:cytidine deaminase [Lachnospiraceae bacterium]
MNAERLIEKAKEARTFAYVTYSDFAVGAALLAKNGQVFSGCNVENGAYSPSICAERTAFSKAVSEGVCEFEAIAIVGGPRDKEPENMCPPCGVCRQVMQEFCDPKTFMIYLNDGSRTVSYRLEELFPAGFVL